MNILSIFNIKKFNNENSKIFIKKIDKNEQSFINMLSDDIFPTYEITNNLLNMKKYPMTLFEYQEKNNIENEIELDEIPEKINILIDKIHKLGIFHGDLHSNNILIDPSNMEVRIIDFGKSVLIEDLEDNSDYYIKYYNDFWETNFKTIEELLDFEYNMWRDF